MDNKLKKKIESEICKMNNHFSANEPLLRLFKLGEPDLIEKAAAGAFLQSFYTGIERTVLLIFKDIGENIPDSSHWHKSLLERAFESTEKRAALFNNEHKDQLKDYLAFRHFIKGAYEYEIDIERLKPLISGVEELWKALEKDINKFIEN